MYIPGNPTTPYNHPTHYEPIWQTADELGLTLCMRRNHGGPPDATDWDRSHLRRWIRSLSEFENGRREVDCGWAPFWVQTMMHHWDIRKIWFPVKL